MNMKVTKPDRKSSRMSSMDFPNLVNQSAVKGNDSCPAEPQHLSISVFFCMVLLLGLLLNIFSMWVFLCRTPEWKAGTVLQFHLAISDIIICPLAPLFLVYVVLGGHWPFGRVMCQLKIILMIVHFYGSILFLTLISIHRYVSVVYHSQASRMKQKSFVQKLCFAVWITLLIKATVCVSILDTTTTTKENRTLCFSIHQEQNTDIYFSTSFILLILGFLVPLVVSAFCYSRLMRSMAGISVCHQKGKLIKSKSRKMVAVCLLIFGLCFMPMNVIRTVMVMVKKYFPNNCSLLTRVETAYYVSWIFSLVNCCLDPLIYCFASQKFTKAIRSSLRKIGVGVQVIPRDNEQDSGLTTHIGLAPVTIHRESIATSDIR